MLGNLHNYTGRTIYFWIWCNIFLASAIFSVVKIFFVTNNPLVIVGFVCLIQTLNLVYYESNRVLFWATFLPHPIFRKI